MTRNISLVILTALSLLFSARQVSAQSAVYVTGTGFADIKRFSTTNAGYYGNEDFSMDGTAAGGGLRIGTYLHPRWSLELAVDVGGKTKTSSPYAVILADAPRSQGLDLTQSTEFLTISSVVGFHPPAHGRLRLGYLAGFGFVRGTYRSQQYPQYPYYVLGTPVNGPITNSATLSTTVAIYPPPVPVFTALKSIDNTTGAVLGFEAAIDLTKHLALVPEVRALTFSSPNDGPAIFLIRPGVGVRWNF